MIIIVIIIIKGLLIFFRGCYVEDNRKDLNKQLIQKKSMWITLMHIKTLN